MQYRAGYQGKSDAMRSRADALSGPREFAPQTIMSSAAACKEPLRKFAAGGVGKIRHDEATAIGMPKKCK